MFFKLLYKLYYIFQSGTKGWQDGSKLPGHTLGNLTPADRHGSVQVSNFYNNIIKLCCKIYSPYLFIKTTIPVLV